MTPALLLKSLCSFMETAVKEFVLESRKKELKPPQIVPGALPPKNKLEVEDFPYIIVRIIDGEDTEDDSTMNVKLLFGTYSEDFDGFYDLLNLMEFVRQRLFKQRTINKKYRIERPYKWKIFEDQPYPQWIGEAVSIWTVANVIEEVGFLHGEID